VANESVDRPSERRSWRHKRRPWGQPDPRVQLEIEKLQVHLSKLCPGYDRMRQTACRDADDYLARARDALKAPVADNETAWTWFHAARREELRLVPDSDLRLLEIDQREEINAKLRSWRKTAVNAYPTSEWRVRRVVSTQKHLDETAENDNRKRLLQRRQLIIYLGSLVVALLAICVLEFVGRGLILAEEGYVDGWWLVAAVLYGTLGGSFSSAQRVAAAGPAARFPELRWAQLANTFRPLAGGAGALVAFAALEADALGASAGSSGPRVALVCFVAGFSERFIPSLAAQQLPAN
jgi:hypothetical protein